MPSDFTPTLPDTASSTLPPTPPAGPPASWTDGGAVPPSPPADRPFPGPPHRSDLDGDAGDATGPPPPPLRSSGGGGGRSWRPLPILAASVLSAVLASGVTTTLVDDHNGHDSTPVVAQTAAAPSGTTATPTPVVDGSERVASAAAAIAPAVVQIQTTTGVGSGVIYDKSGLVLTVAHVVGSSRQVDVRLADGSTVRGDVVGADKATDIAVVRIDAADVGSVATLATDSEPVVGQLTVAVGSPFGFDQTVTSGIVSAVDRVVNDVAMVQTDAAINPGNSGGPLVDGRGQVIGLSDVIFTQSGGNEGVGFAIEIDLAHLVADQLVAGQPVQLALLGVSTTAPADGSRGAQVAEVVSGSAADDAGLQVGDLLVSIDGTPVPDGGKLRAEIIRRAPGTTVTIGIQRNGAPQDVSVTLGSTGN